MIHTFLVCENGRGRGVEERMGDTAKAAPPPFSMKMTEVLREVEEGDGDRNRFENILYRLFYIDGRSSARAVRIRSEYGRRKWRFSTWRKYLPNGMV